MLEQKPSEELIRSVNPSLDLCCDCQSLNVSNIVAKLLTMSGR